MTSGRPSGLILRFALPLLVGNFLQQMYNAVDSIVVGNFVGKEALAAVGSTAILTFLLFSLFMGLALGFTILVSQFLGAGDRCRIKRATDTAYLVVFVGSLLVTVAGLLAVNPLLVLMNTPVGPTRDMSRSYLSIIFLGTIFNFGYTLNAGVLQGLGDAVSSLVFLAVATVTNILLDLLFVAVLRWGVAGAAWATIISQGLSFFLGAVFIVRKLKLTTLRPRDLRFDRGILSASVRIGLPAGFQNMLFSLGTMAIQRLINSYGPAFMAGFGSSDRIASIAFLPIASFSSAVTTFVGQNIGAGKLERVRAGVRATIVMSLIVCVVLSVAIVATAPFLVSLFTKDGEVIQVGSEVLYRLMPSYPLLVLLFTINAALRGAGESFWPFVAAMVSFLFVRVPAAYLLDRWFGRAEIGWCYGAGWVVGVVIALWYYESGRWKLRAQARRDSAT